MTEYGVKVKYQVSGAEAAVNSAEQIVDKLDEIVQSVNRVNDKLDEMGKTGEEGFENVGEGAEGSALQVAALVSIIEKVAQVTAGVIRKLGEAFSEIMSQSIEYASALEESANVVEVTFGKQSDAVKDWSKNTREAYGINEKDAMTYVGTMGSILKASGVADNAIVEMSENLVNLAGDLASFKNLDVESAFSKIQAGIIGQTRGLTELGYRMSEANLNAYAMAKGLSTTYDKMSDADQILLRYAYLLDNTADAHGDYERTSEGYANGLRTLQKTWEELIGTIASAKDADGVSILDRIAEIIGRITDMLRSEAATDIINKIRKHVFRLLDALERVVGFVELVIDKWDEWGGVIEFVAGAILVGVAALAALSVGIIAVNVASLAVKATMEGINTIITIITAHPIIALISAIIAVILIVIKVVQELTDRNESFFGALMGSLSVAGTFIINTVRGVVDFVFDIIDGLVNQFIDVANFIANVFRDPLGAAARLFADFADDVLGVLGALAGVIDSMFGSNLKGTVMGWTSGLRDWANKQGNGQYEQVVKRIDLSTSALGWDRWSYADAYNDGVDMWEDWFSTEKTPGEDKELKPYGSTDAILDMISGISDDTGAIKNNTADNSSELAALRELAEQAAATRIANITISAPVSSSVTMNGSGETDIDGFINRFTEALSEGLNSSFTSSITLFEEAF